MYKVKIFTVTLALMTVFGAAQAQGLRGLIRNAVAPKSEQPTPKPAQVQGITPEAAIGQTPDLPSVAYLAHTNPDDEAAYTAITAFHEKIAELRAKSVEADVHIDRQAEADRVARQMTGRSAAEIQNMSDAEQEAMAQQMAQKQLTAAGLGNMTLADLEALEGKSDEEIMAAMAAGGATAGGLTMAEIQAMEKMTDAQRAAYMQQGGRAQRVQAATSTARQQRGAQAQVDASAEMKRIGDRWAAIDRQNEKETQDVTVKCAEIAARYNSQIAAVPPSDDDTEPIERIRLRSARNTECFTLWRNAVSQMQGRVKTKMADVARYDELLAQSMANDGMPVAMPSIGYQIAGEYLDLTESVTTLPEVMQSQPNIN